MIRWRSVPPPAPEREPSLREEFARLRDALDAVGARLEALAERHDVTTLVPASTEARSRVATIERWLRIRRWREDTIGEQWFSDPCWDMLLDLYAAELDRRDVSVSDLCIAACTPPTTALRWIVRMERDGLVLRVADPRDRRRVFVRLTPDGRARLDAFFDRVVGEGA